MILAIKARPHCGDALDPATLNALIVILAIKARPHCGGLPLVALAALVSS